MAPMNKLMSWLRRPACRSYGFGLLCVMGGAGVTSMVGSMWPLALGSSVAVMCTAALVRDIRGQAAARRVAPKPSPPKRRS